MAQGRKLSEVSLNILKMIWEEGKMAVYDWETAGHELDMAFNRRKFYQYMYNLERSGYLKRPPEKKNQSFFHLTPAGRLEVLKYLHLEKIRKGRWDGRWRVLVFDVPEAARKWRDRIRNGLKELGFHALQESVYITPYPVAADLDKFLKKWRLKKYCRYLTVTEIDNDQDLKDIFGLK